jgi:hypothetical protein
MEVSPQMPLVNTSDETDYAPAFSGDGKTIYFTRTVFKDGKRVKPGTIYQIQVKDLGWGTLRNNARFARGRADI